MRGMSKKDALACQVSLGLFAGLLGIASTAHGMPVHDGGGVKGVRAGGAVVGDPSGGVMNITSTTKNNVIGWKDFSIKSGEIVQFDGGKTKETDGAKNYLNIVMGNVTSHIDGTMRGGNNVYIANTHGVVFGDGASVDVGSLYVTTRKLDADSYTTAPDMENNPLITVSASTKAADSSAKADVVSLIDGSGSLKANKIVLEGRSVRIMNDAAIQSPTSGGTPEVYALSDQSEFSIPYGGSYDANTKTITGPNGTNVPTKKLADHKGYVHIGYAGAEPVTDGTGKYKNLAPENMYKLVGSAAGTATVADLNGMTNMSGRYMLRGDVDFANAEHTPIGTINKPFKGKFDGMFRTISNMKLPAGSNTASTSSSTESYAGLFGNASGAEIMNLGLKEADLSAVIYGGGIVGSAKDNTRISAVYNESSKKIGTDAGVQVGGIAGWIESSVIDQAYNTAPISNAGGIVGTFKNSQLYAVYNTGTVGVKSLSSSSVVSYGIYQKIASGPDALIKDAYTATGSVVGPDADGNAHAYDSYVLVKQNDSTKPKYGKVLAQLAAPSLKTENLTADGEESNQKKAYASWDISDEGGANTTWRIFAGQSTPLLTAFMKGTVQAEYSYADFQQANHGHSDNIASGYTVQAEDKKNGSYVKRAGTESNGGKDITRTYNADYLRIAHKSGDNYTHVTSVGTTDDDIKLYGAKDRSLVELNNADSQGNGGGGGRRNAGKEAMLFSGQHGYDIAGANVDIAPRKVVGNVAQMGKIEREYDGKADVGTVFKDAIKAGDVSLRTEGLVDGDGADMTLGTDAVTFRDGWENTSSLSKDAGYNKAVYIDGSKVNFGNAEGNYEFDATEINKEKKLKGNILQKTVTVGFKAGKNFNKTYDSKADVKDEINPQKAAGADVLELTGVVGSEDLKLNNSDITAKYMKDKSSDADENASGNAKVNRDIAYKNIKLADGTTGKAKNYKLVEKDNESNVLYREKLTGEPSTAGEAVTSGTLWGTGTISRRNINKDTFLWDGGAATKEYDGSTEWIKPNGASDANKKITAKKAEDTGVADEGLIQEDVDKIDFTLESGKGEFRDGTTATKNVSEAKKVAYQVTATNKNADEDVLSNYKIGGENAVSGGKYDVTSEGKITPRVIDVDLLKKTDIDKTYDGKTNVVEDASSDARKYLTMGKGWVGYAASSKTLVGDENGSGTGTDGATVTVTAVYRKQGEPAASAADKNVVRDAADTKKGLANGKDVYYTFTLEGDGGHAAKNYTFNAGGTAQATKDNVKGTGTIDPKELKAQFNKVSRSYNNTSDVTPSQVKQNGYTLTGVVSGDENKVSLNTGDTSPLKGTYYKNGEEVKNRGTNYTVKYKGISKALVKGTAADDESGNYWIADTAEGLGDITKAKLKRDSFHMSLKDRVTKVYDWTNEVRSDSISEVKAGDTKLELNKGYSFDNRESGYYNTTENTGKFRAPNANVAEDGTTFHKNGTKEAKAYGVKYTIRLLGDVADNYDLSELAGGDTSTGKYTVSDDKITFERDGIGYIKSRRVYVNLAGPAMGTPEKAYDGTTKLKVNDGTTSQGKDIVAMGHGGYDDAGIVDDAINVSRGRYQNRNAGKVGEDYSQKVVYTPEIKYPNNSNGVETNYVFYHGAQQPNAPKNPYAEQKWIPGNPTDSTDPTYNPNATPLLGRGKITPADLLVKAPDDVKRQYNGDIDVKKGQGRLDLIGKLKHESAPGANDEGLSAGKSDDVGLNDLDENTTDGKSASSAGKYYRHYISSDANVEDTEENKANRLKYTTYRRIQLVGEDAGNYRLFYNAKGQKKSLAVDTENYGDNKTYYTMSGYGLIEKRKVTSDKLKIGLKTAHPEKIYDGNAYVVGKAAAEDKTHQAWNDLIERIYVEDGTEKITVDKSHTSVTDAKYLAGVGKRAKDAADGKDVELRMNFDTSALKNFDFTDPSMTNGTFAYKTTGSIKKKAVTATLTKTMDLRKVYDKTNVAANANVKYEGVIEEDKDTAKINITKAQYEKKAGDTNANHDGMNATVDPFAAAQNIYDVAYEFDLTGADAGNYELNTKKLTGSGDIERRMAFADTVHPNLMKYYDGTNAAKSYNQNTNVNEDIEDKDLTNANAAKSIKLLDAAGAEFSDDRLKNRATGLLAGDTWSAKGEFDDKNAGENKKVTYKITLSDGANDNYRIYKKSDLDAKHANGATLNDVVGATIRTDAGKAELTDVGTVKKANLLVKADEAQKVYDGSKNTDTVEGNILTKLKLDGVYYDTTKSAVKTGGAYEGTATLNHEKGKDEYRAEYRDPNVKPKDGKANAVNYSHIQLVDQANNYNLVYQTAEGIKNLEADTTAGYYKLEGKGKITPLEISDMDLNPDFKPDAIKKTYDGTKDIKDAKEELKKSKARVWVTKKGTNDKWDITDIEGAYSATGEYKDTEIGGKTLKAKDAGEKKDVTFAFTMDENNFLYNGAGGEKLKTIKKDFAGIGTITRRYVKLTLQDVQKIYDGTTGVKNGYYEGRGSTLKEHANQDVTLRDLIHAEEAERDDKTGVLKNERGLLGTDGVALDLANLDAQYLDKNANRSPYSPGTKKEVGYKLRLTGDAKAEDNYEFEVYDNNNKAISQANKTADYNVIGHGDIWYKKVEFDLSQLDKEYDGNANLTEKTLKEKLLLKGAVDGENLSLDDAAIQKIKNGSYGDRKADGSFTQNPHVKRRNGSTGEVVARDVRLKGLDEAMASLSDRDVNGAKNYFYNGYVDESGTYVHPEDMVYGKGKITPKTVKLQKTWVGGFEKPYDGTSTAKLKGADGRYYSFGEASTVGEKDSDETKKIKQAVKQAFYDKLHLSVDLGTGEGAIHLGYKLYGDAEGDDPANMPYYANPTTKERDANVHNDGALQSKKKDVVYRLKEVASSKDYKDWELDPGDMEARLLDGTYKPDGTTEGTSPLGYTATITPRRITVDEKNTAPLAKIYDGTDTVRDLLRVGEKPLDSVHPDFAYQGILETDKGKVKVEATSTDGRFHDRRTDAADKNATLDAKSWEELAKRKDYSEYNTKNESGKVVHYNLALKSVQHPDSPNEAEKIALGNYEVASTYDASAEIVKRKVKVELDAVAPETLTRDYDGSTKAAVRGLHFSPTNDAHTGLVGTEQALLRGGNTRQGIYDTKDVKRDANGVVRKNAHTITYGNLALNDDAVSKNYEIDPANLQKDKAHPEYGSFLQDSGTINPKGLKAELLRQDVQKQYDGTREVKDNAYGTFREGNFRKVMDNEDNNEKNLKEILTKDNKTFHLDANFDSAGASALDANKQSKADKQVTYDIAWNNGNYKLLDKDGNDLTQTKVDKSGVSFTATVRTQPQSGTIYRRRLQVTASEAQKVYDGTTHVKNAWGNLHFANVDKDGSVLKGETPFANSQEEQRAKNIVNAKAAYDNPNATDPKAKNPEESALMNHVVTYRFEDADDVMKNYEILDGSQKNVDVIKGTGKIRRRTLDVLPDWQATYAGKGGMNYTGRIADGSAQANGGSSLTPEVAVDLLRFNSGVFFYGPEDGADYRTPAKHDILGWYTKNGKKTLASGNYGSNYTLRSVPSKLFVAPRVDKVVPERTIRPDSKVYERAAFDESNAFGKSKDLNAALAYKGEGVNIGGTKPQQGMSANVGDVGIRQQGTGTNISGSAGVGGTAGVNGKVQGATGAANEAARAAGAQPGASVKPQSAQSGASVKPQGTTGGNAALAGGTASSGGYYSPSAQPGASVKPQGAQSGAAVKPQGAASAVGSAGSAVGAGSVVDRGLAAAVGMSVGSSSDARTGASSSRRSADYSSAAGSYADGSSRAADRGLANALGKGVGSAGYYSGKGYSHTNDDEEEEIKKKTKASA